MSLRPIHVIFAGLPGVGKTTLARETAKRLSAVYLRIDSLEQALANSGAVVLDNLGPGGYHAAAAVAEDNLRNGMPVVSDSVNPFAATRDIWIGAAINAAAPYFSVEVVCSDREEHRRRVEKRKPDLPKQRPPAWEDVLAREYEPWREASLRVDTGRMCPEEAVRAILAGIARCDG